MNSFVYFLLGLSFALNLSLGGFLIFLFKKQESHVYEVFDKKIESVKEEADPFRNL